MVKEREMKTRQINIRIPIGIWGMMTHYVDGVRCKTVSQLVLNMIVSWLEVRSGMFRVEKALKRSKKK